VMTTSLNIPAQDNWNEPGCIEFREKLQFAAQGPCPNVGEMMAPWGECLTPTQMAFTMSSMRALCGSDATLDAWLQYAWSCVSVVYAVCSSNPGACVQYLFR